MLRRPFIGIVGGRVTGKSTETATSSLRSIVLTVCQAGLRAMLPASIPGERNGVGGFRGCHAVHELKDLADVCNRGLQCDSIVVENVMWLLRSIDLPTAI